LFPSFTSAFGGNASNQQQQLLISNMVDAMTIESTRRRITPYDPALRSVLGSVEKKCISNPEHVLSYPDPYFGAPWQDESRKSQIIDSIKSVMDVFKLKKRDTIANKRKVFWNDIIVEGGESFGTQKFSAKVARIGELDVTTLTTISKTETSPSTSHHTSSLEVEPQGVSVKLNIPQFSLGSTDPIKDFKAVLIHSAASESDFSNAFQTMMTLIERSIVLRRETLHYKKAIEYLSVLREESINNGRVAEFNTFMVRKMKQQLGIDEKYSEMWNILKTSGLSLISDTEVSTFGAVSEEEKNTFLNPVETEKEVVLKNSVQADEFTLD
jgi:hypothetical protein